MFSIEAPYYTTCIELHKMWKRALVFTLLVCVYTQHTAIAVPAELDLELEGGGDDIAPEDECVGTACHSATTKGEKGDTGAQGSPGFCNASSCSGLIEKGEQGQKGESGVPGSDGVDGAPGVMGPPELAGMKGELGQAGMKGVSGEPGTPGSTGVPGKRGLPGAPGSPGIDGSDGTPGEKGDSGEPGVTVQVLPEVLSESCTESLQGTIRFDPTTKLLYFCNGTSWVCIQTMDCPGESPTCPSPLGQQKIGDSWYQVFVGNITQATQDAADIVLVIDESGTMSMEHEWLLVMIPLLESALIENGVGDGDTRNRYCVIGFGGFGTLRAAHFRAVSGQACYTAAEFPLAQRQLVTAGLFEDGYQAIKFGLDNVPFRESPFIAKNVLLVTDEGRTVIQEGASITKDSIEAELKAKDILLNVIVFADYQLENEPNKTVIGVDARGKSLILEPNGAFSETDQRVLVTRAERNTAEAYVDLAVSVGGAAWALRVLRESSVSENKDLQESFTSALTEIKLREIRAVIESCRKCTCVAGDSGDSVKANCVIAEDDAFCRCVVENGESSTCQSGLPGNNDNIVSGGLVRTSNSITSIDRAPNFMMVNAEILNL